MKSTLNRCLKLFVLAFVVFSLNSINSTPAKAGIGSYFKKAKRSVLGKKKTKLSTRDIIAGLKEALKVGTKKAVKRVGRKNGYYGNSAIRIPLPNKLKKVAKALRRIGLGKKVDELVLKMNRGAEQAAPKAFNIFWNAVKRMSIRDAKNILYSKRTNEATLYFERHTRSKLYRAFHPIIKRALNSVGATKVYKYIIKRYNRLPFVKKQRYDLDVYVTNKALDGLFKMLANEERKIRKSPAARVSRILKKVFGAL